MVRTLLYEYKKTRRELRRYLDEVCKRFEKDIRYLKKICDYETLEVVEMNFMLIKKDYNIMISNVEYAIDWISHGRQPGLKRGADRTNVYLKDPLVMDTCGKYQPINYEDNEPISNENKERLQKALCELTDREKDIYILHYAEQLTCSEIGKLLGVKKETIRTTLKRAKRKIEIQKERM